jgi:hypothetical protein
MKTIKISAALIGALCGLSGSAHAAVVGAPQQPSCLQSSFSIADATNKWYTAASINIINKCNAVVDLKNAAISFKSNSNSLSPIWTWPFSSSAVNYANGVANFTLTWTGDQYSPSTLAVGASKTLSFGITLSGQVFDVASAQQSLQVIPSGTPPTPNNGQINLLINPAGMSGVTGAETITLSSGTFSQQVINSVWNTPSSYPVTGLAYGTYNISAAPIGNYLPLVSPATVTVNSATPQAVTVTYRAKPSVGTVSIVLPAAPLSGLSSGIPVTLKDQTTGQVYNQTVAWNNAGTFSNLPAGDTVAVTLPTSSNGQNLATPNPIAPFNVIQNITISKTVSYQVTPQATVPVPFILNGLTASNATISLKDTYGNQFQFTNLGNGTVNKALPVSDSFNVTASAPNLYATVTPASFNTSAQGNQAPVNVLFSAAGPQQLAAYWAGWMGYGYDLNNTYGKLPITDLYMAFANYVNGQIDTSASGYFSVIPVPLSQVWPSYQNWTTYKYNHPNVHIMMSVGGASYSAMWANLNSAAAAQAMAQSIVTILNTPYPVYAPSSPSQPSSAFAVNGPAGSAGSQYGNSSLLGYVTMSGVDLDVEVQNLPAITPYLIMLAEDIHQAAPTKLISFATFSTAADPANCIRLDPKCTYPGSQHSGEALGLIQGINNNQDTTLKSIVNYNVMAYDAGQSYVSGLGIAPFQRYQVALKNYTAAVGNPSHVILGLDIQTQWGTPYFAESCSDLNLQAVWAYQHPTTNGGAFLWEIGDDRNCPALTVLTSMMNAKQ